METLNKLIKTKIQSGFYQIGVFLFLVSIDLTDGGNVAIMGLIMPNIKNEFSLSTGAVSLLISIYFIGTSAGSMIVGKFADKYGRRKIIIIGLVFQILICLAIVVCYDFFFLLILRFLFGFSYGFSLPMTTVYITEIVPNESRGKWIVSINFFITIGKLYGTLLGYIVLKDLNQGDWRRLILYSAILPCLSCIVAYSFLIESLRYLFINRKFEELRISFNKIVNWNNSIVVYRDHKVSSVLTELEWQQIVSAKVEDEFTEEIASYQALLKPKWIKITILLWIILFNINFMFFGQLSLLPFLLSGSSSGIASIILTISGEIPVIFLTYFMIDNPEFGRKNSLLYFSIASVCFNIVSFFSGEFGLSFFLFFARFFMKGIFTAVYPLSSESYPTSFRSIGYGFASGIGRLGACVMPFFIFLLFEWYRYADFLLFGLNGLLCAGAAFYFPFDMTGQTLDQTEPMISEMKTLKECNAELFE